MGSNDRIIPLVTGGEPEDVFPPALLTTTVLDEATGEYVEREVEPLAANVSSTSLKGSLSALKTEFLRIAAPLLYCGYDNLFLRDRRRRRKKVLIAGASVTAAVVLFTLYTLTMLMKISSQNADLEKKNYELDLSNSNLTAAYSNLDTANSELTKINSDLDIANSDLKKSNTALDDANTDLKNANTALDNSNAELSQKKKDLENVNSELQNINTQLDNSNAELQKTNTALDLSNAELQNANTALDQSNNRLQESNKALDESNIVLKETNEALEAAKKNAEDREQEAVAAREVAEVRRQEAEEAKKKAEDAEAAAKESEAAAIKAEKEAEEARDAEEQQRKKAEEARDEAEEKNRQLMKANAEISAANADSTFSYNYDRIGALQQAISTPLYEEDDAEILPSTTHFLNKALYSMTVNNNPRLTDALEAQGYIKDFRFSPENKYIITCGNAKFVNVFDVSSGEMVYNAFDETLCDACLTDESHIVIVNYSAIKCINFLTGEEEWSRTVSDITRREIEAINYCEFSDDADRVALWDNKGYFAFLDTHTGKTIDTYRTSRFMDYFYNNKEEDFSDGIHFSTVCFKSNADKTENYIISYDLSRKRYTMMPMGTSRVISTHGVGSDCIAAACYVPVGDDYHSQLRIYDRMTARLQASVELYDDFVTDLAAADTVTVEKDGVTTEYAAVFGTRSHDHRSVVYFVDIETGDTITYFVNARVMGVKSWESNNGKVDIITENGDLYCYDLITGSSSLDKTTYDSETSHADGSVKIVWTKDGLVAALGKNSSKIFIYRVENEPDYEIIFENVYGIYQVLESDRYIVAINEGSVFVFGKENNEFLYQADVASYFRSDDTPVIYQSYLVTINRNDNTIYAYSLEDGALAWEHKIDSRSSINSYSLNVSQDGETLAAVTPYSICRITGGDSFETVSHIYPVPSDDRTDWYVSLNPNGDSVIMQYCVLDSSQSMPYTLYWCKYDFTTEEWQTLAQESKTIVVFAKDITSFTDDGSLAAVTLSDRIMLFSVDDGAAVNEIPLTEETVTALTFEADGDKLLVLYENGYLKEFDVHTGAELNTAAVPAAVFTTKTFSTNYRNVALCLNDAYNELMIFNEQYACFIDLSYFEVVSETYEDSVTIYGFNESTQQLMLNNGSGDLVLAPHYPKEYLFGKAGQLVNSVG